MKKVFFTALYCTVVFSNQVVADDHQILLEEFHKYGIKNCDNFIWKNSPLKSNWNFFVDKNAGGIDGPATEVTMTQIFGTKGDTVKVVDTYIQTTKQCFLRSSWTLTNPGPCSEHIDGNSWYVSTEMPNKDYTTYKNSGGVEVQAKEISVGNFKACIQEGFLRKSGNHG
jgi:hypothetical protein